MKKPKTKYNKMLVVLIVLILFIISIFFVKFVMKKTKERQIIKEKKYYSLKLDVPNTKIDTIDSKINQIVLEGKDKVLKTVKTQKKHLKKNKLTCEFITQFETHKLDNLNITSIVFRTYCYLGGANYETNVYTFNYNNSKELAADYFFKENYLEKLSNISYYKLLELKEKDQNLVLLEEENLKKGLAPTKENFTDYYFTNDGLEIIFSPFQVAPGYIGYVKVNIPYSEIKDILKIKVIKEEEIKVENGRELRDINTLKDKKLVAFTFDDGPAYKNTTRLLDEVKSRNAKVSFFLLGSRIGNQKEIVARMYKEGHTVGNHTYSHLNLHHVNNYETYKEIQNTSNAICEIIGEEPKFLRPPYGNINEHIKEIYKNPIMLWSIDTEDWKYKNANKIKENILKDVKDGSVVLLHDLYPTSVDGALLAMDELKNQGYEFVSLEEMFAIKGIEIDNNQEKYFSF